MLQPGDRIGDWIVDGPLGAGGMGAVYLAHSVLSERVRAACKTLNSPDVFSSRERFIREVDTLAALNHPAIVRVLSGGEDPGRGVLYLFMEYVGGEDLKLRLARGPLSVSEVYNVFRQVGDGLRYAHSRGVTHRDLKPANIMLSADGTARLVDFGIAAEEGRTQLTNQGTVPGTLAYIDPVAFGGPRPDFKRADIYALGLVMWESLTGRTAFPEDPGLSAGQQMARMMRLKLESEALDPGPAFPDSLRRLVKRATEPDPDRRLADLDSFLEQLARSVSGRPEISAESTGDGVTPAPRVLAPENMREARVPWGMIGAGVFVVVLLLALVGLAATAVGVTWWASGRTGGGGAKSISPPQITFPTATPQVQTATARVGQTAILGPYRLAVSDVEVRHQVHYDVFNHAAADGWNLLLMTVNLASANAAEVTLMSPFSVVDRHPYTFTESVACQLAVEDGMESVLTIPANGRVSGRLCFEVAADARGLKLRFQPDMMNDGWNLQVDLGR